LAVLSWQELNILFAEFMKANYVVDKSKNFSKRDPHFYQCRADNRPHVFIVPYRKFALVEMDMISTDRNLDTTAIEAIFNVMVEIAGKDAEIACDTLRCRAAKAPKIVAEALAARIYQLAYDAMPRLKYCGGFEKPLMRNNTAVL
jgi:hypothetical protein